MKRKGYIYERMTDWDLVKRAEIESAKNKPNSYGVVKHKRHWLPELIRLHDMAIAGTVRTGRYKREQVVSGQDKLRDIAKLNYYPDNIWQQMLVLAGEEEIERSFIGHTYANRKGKGQTAALKQLQRWLRDDPKDTCWGAKGDICKYYDSIPHALARKEMERTFKDERYINAFLEPIAAYSDTGRSIPIGIRPSQTLGNLCLRRFHRYVKEVLHVKYFIMYLDDFLILGATKGEVERNYRRAAKYLEGLGFRLHAPKFCRVSQGYDMLGYVTYENGNSYWRRKNKARWLRRRHGVRSKRRLREIDAAAWGSLKHGNKDCKRLYEMITLQDMGIRVPAATDKQGNKIIDYPKIAMQMLFDKEVTVVDYVENITTKMGEGRMAIAVEWDGKTYKVITNSQRIKATVLALSERNVTRYVAQFFNRGGNNYDITVKDITEVDGRRIAKDLQGNLIYVDNNERIIL